MKTNPGRSRDNRDFFIAINGRTVPVSEAVYFAYKRPVWRERKRRQVRTDREQSLDALLDLDLEPTDPNPLVEDIVADRMTLDVLYHAMSCLSEKERSMIQALFYDGKSERAVADETGVPQKTINNRKKHLLDKLRKIL